MGYTTDFSGTLKLNRQLTLDEKTFLDKLASTRRMARNVDPKYGVEGEFYVEGDDWNDPTVPDGNRHPSTQPGLWCQWVPTKDGMGIEWDGNEKFYNYVEWLEYIINSVFPHILKEGDEPLVLNGEVKWQGEDSDDIGIIKVTDNQVDTVLGFQTFDEAGTRVFFVVDGAHTNEELFETLEAAQEHEDSLQAGGEENTRIRVCIVRNAYRESDGGWNYDDQSNTFEEIKTIEG